METLATENELSFVATTFLSDEFEKDERVLIDINTDTGEIFMRDFDDSKGGIFFIDNDNPPSGFVKFDILNKTMVIEEWLVLKNEDGSVDIKAIIHQFEDVEMVAK